MNWNTIVNSDLKERMALSHQSKVKFLLIMTMAVTFQHSFSVLDHFHAGLSGQISNGIMVLLIDFLTFFSLDLIGNENHRARRFLGWFVFLVNAGISGFLNIYYFWFSRPDAFDTVVSASISILLGGIAPVAIVFLGIVYRESATTRMKAEAKRHQPEAPRSVTSGKAERNKRIIELHKANKTIREIHRITGVSRRTISQIIKTTEVSNE